MNVEELWADIHVGLKHLIDMGFWPPSFGFVFAFGRERIAMGLK